MAANSVEQSAPQPLSDAVSAMEMASIVSCGTSGGESAASVTSSERLHNRQFGFEAQSSYSARAELMCMRDENFHIRPALVDDDIWKRPPPDFRRQCFEANPPKRNSREAMQPWRYGPLPAELKAEAEARKVAEKDTMALPDLMKPRMAKEADFDLKFHVGDIAETKADFVTNGKFKPEPYENPRRHNYRPYQSLKTLGLPEFQTIFDADPFDIKFNSARLGIIHGLSRGVPPERNIKGQQMAPALHQPPKWEARLHLPAGPWPEPVAQYSRFRPFWRSPQTVLLDRMEQTLASKWATEKEAASTKAMHRTLIQSNYL